MSGLVRLHSKNLWSKRFLSIYLFSTQKPSSFEDIFDKSSGFLFILVVKTMLKHNCFLYPLANFLAILKELDSFDFFRHNMLAYYMLELAVQLTEAFFRPNDSHEEFEERVKEILEDPKTVQNLIELRKKVELERISLLIIDLKNAFREKIEGAEKEIKGESLEILKGSKYFYSFLGYTLLSNGE